MRLGRLDSADFDQVEVVLLLDAQFPHRLSSGRRAGGYPDPEQAVGELVFADQFAERFSGLPLLFFLFFRAEEPPAQRVSTMIPVRIHTRPTGVNEKKVSGW